MGCDMLLALPPAAIGAMHFSEPTLTAVPVKQSVCGLRLGRIFRPARICKPDLSNCRRFARPSRCWP